jgi:hypothetical protein
VRRGFGAEAPFSFVGSFMSRLKPRPTILALLKTALTDLCRGVVGNCGRGILKASRSRRLGIEWQLAILRMQDVAVPSVWVDGITAKKRRGGAAVHIDHGADGHVWRSFE